MGTVARAATSVSVVRVLSVPKANAPKPSPAAIAPAPSARRRLRPPQEGGQSSDTPAAPVFPRRED